VKNYLSQKIKIRVITKLPNSEQSYKGKVKTHNYINRQNQSTTGKLYRQVAVGHEVNGQIDQCHRCLVVVIVCLIEKSQKNLMAYGTHFETNWTPF
jgi:hypothetical protein